MGQYFKIVNLDKKEVVSPWSIGGVAKWWEWVLNIQARVFVWLLRQSDGDGGGDIHERDGYQILGRWAGDRVTLIGDYDSSELWQQTQDWPDIGELVRAEFNEAMKKDGTDELL